MAIEMDDDVIFADLSKQIALLIMDDDEEFPVQSPWPPLHLQGYHHLPESVIPPPYTYEMTYRRETSKGTGVFIPRSSSLPRRKNRSGKSTSNNNNSQRQSNKSKVSVSHVANSSRLHSNYYANSGALKTRA